MTELFRGAQDATELSPEARTGLKQSWITTRGELNEAEQENIVAGAVWARRARDQTSAALLSDLFARTLHRRMFGQVWSWAGIYRNNQLNIGIEPHGIRTEIANVFGDVRYWVDHSTYPPDEIAIRLHHRIVIVHPFQNGNGRHSRLMADLLAERLGSEPLGWGRGALVDRSTLRDRYIAALKAADAHDIVPLLDFARS